MSLEWVVALVLMLSGLGAYFWARPTATERRLTQIRAQAMRSGLSLTTLHVPDWSISGRVNQATHMITGYRLREERHKGPFFSAMRTSGNAGQDLPEGWEWLETDYRALGTQLRQIVALSVAELPDWVSLVSATPRGWVLAFDERTPEQVDEVRRILDELSRRTDFRS